MKFEILGLIIDVNGGAYYSQLEAIKDVLVRARVCLDTFKVTVIDEDDGFSGSFNINIPKDVYVLLTLLGFIVDEDELYDDMHERIMEHNNLVAEKYPDFEETENSTQWVEEITEVKILEV